MITPAPEQQCAFESPCSTEPALPLHQHPALSDGTGLGWAGLLQPGEAAVQEGKEGISAHVLRVTSFSSLNFSERVDNTTPALQPLLLGNGAWAAVGRALCLSMG